MNKITNKIALVALMGIAATAVAQVADPVVMNINGKDIKKSEFEYSYKKNNGPDVIDHKTVDEYVDLFLNYKLKVEEALAQKMDTLASYNKEFRQYRDQQVLPTVINDNDVEQEAQVIYDNTKKRIGPDGLVDVSHILVLVPQNADAAAQAAAKAKADSIYAVVTKKGADFAAVAKQCSQDPGTAQRGGELGWIQKGQTVKVFEDAAFALKDGKISEPVLSDFGYHIIKKNGHKQLEPYSQLRDDIYKFIEARRLREGIARSRVQAIAKEKGISPEKVMDQRADSIAAISEDMKYLIQEYHDGLLLFEVSQRDVWQKAEKDEKGLQSFFKKNQKKYKWDEPRFKGIAYYTRNADDVKNVQKAVKGKKFDKWADILRTTFNKDSVLRIRVEKGIFKKGDNKIVDRDIFGVKDAKVKEIKDFPNTATFGKTLKAPEEMDDVRALVVNDYQEQMEKAWVEGLRKKYPYTVNWDEIHKIAATLPQDTKK